MSGRRAAIAGFVAALLIPIVASAAEPDPRVYTSPTPVADWTVTIGGEARLEPIFQGSKRDLVLPYPILAVRRFGTPEPFRGPRDGVGIGLVGDSVFQVGPVGQLRMPRPERLDGALQGLGSVPWAVELGVFAEYWMVPWLRTRVEVRQGFNGHHGLVSDIFVDAVVPVGTQWTFSGGPRVTLASTAATISVFQHQCRRSLRHRACRCSTPKAACARSEQVPRRVTSGRRSSRPMLSSNTSGSTATRPVRRWLSSAARRTS